MMSNNSNDLEKIKSMSIEDMDLSVRSYNCLKRANIHTVGDICSKTEEELWRIRNLGRKAADEILNKLASYGLYIKGTYKMPLKDVLHKFVILCSEEHLSEYAEDNLFEANALLCFPYISESGELLYRVLSTVYYINEDYYLVWENKEKVLDVTIENIYDRIIHPIENKAFRYKYSAIINTLTTITNADEDLNKIRDIDFLGGYRDFKYPDNYIVRLVDTNLQIVGGLTVKINELLGNDEDGKTLFLGTIVSSPTFTSYFDQNTMSFTSNVGDKVCIWYEEGYMDIAGISVNRMYVPLHWSSELTKFQRSGFTLDETNNIVTSYNGKRITVRIPEGIDEIGEEAFSNNQNIVHVKIPSSVTYIRKNAFSNCGSLRTIEFEKGSSLYVIEDSAFFECKKLEEIKFPKRLEKVGDEAFCKCSSLRQVVLPPNLEKLGKKAFDHCVSVEKVFLPASLTSIGEYAFDCCHKLEKFIVDSRNPFFKAINGNLFDKSDEESADDIYLMKYAAGKKEELYCIPEKTTSVDAYAFHCCDNLRHINISSKLTSIGDFAFRINTLRNIKVDENNLKFKDINGILYSKGGEYLLCYPSGREHIEFSIPSNVKVISANAFFGASNLEHIILPNGLKTIGSFAFYYCNKLQEIEIPKSVKVIERSAFERTTIKNCIIPDGVQELCPKTFFKSEELISVVLPGTITKIGAQVFCSCSKLKNIVYLGTMDKWNKITKGYQYLEGCSNIQIVCLDGIINA